MPDSQFTGYDMEELEALEEITKLKSWKFIRNILTEHRNHCLEKSRQALKNHEDRKAGEWLARADEPQVFFDLIKERKLELSNKRERRK